MALPFLRNKNHFPAPFSLETDTIFQNFWRFNMQIILVTKRILWRAEDIVEKKKDKIAVIDWFQVSWRLFWFSIRQGRCITLVSFVSIWWAENAWKLTRSVVAQDSRDIESDLVGNMCIYSTVPYLILYTRPHLARFPRDSSKRWVRQRWSMSTMKRNTKTEQLDDDLAQSKGIERPSPWLDIQGLRDQMQS